MRTISAVVLLVLSLPALTATAGPSVSEASEECLACHETIHPPAAPAAIPSQVEPVRS